MQSVASSIRSSVQLQRCTLGSRPAVALTVAPARRLAVRTEAAVKPPQGVTLPPKKPVEVPSTFGFVYNAERLNSRAAMIGFFALLLVELVANKGILDLAGFATGNGLGFEL